MFLKMMLPLVICVRESLFSFQRSDSPVTLSPVPWDNYTRLTLIFSRSVWHTVLISFCRHRAGNLQLADILSSNQLKPRPVILIIIILSLSSHPQSGMVEQAPSQAPPTSTSAEQITQRSDESAFKLYKPPSLAQTLGVWCPSCLHHMFLIGELSSQFTWFVLYPFCLWSEGCTSYSLSSEQCSN